MVKGIYVGQNLIFAMIACTGMLYKCFCMSDSTNTSVWGDITVRTCTQQWF